MIVKNYQIKLPQISQLYGCSRVFILQNSYHHLHCSTLYVPFWNNGISSSCLFLPLPSRRYDILCQFSSRSVVFPNYWARLQSPKKLLNLLNLKSRENHESIYININKIISYVHLIMAGKSFGFLSLRS